jgi:hypothetical protein
MLYLFGTTNTYDVHDIRASYGWRAIDVIGTGKANLGNLLVSKGRTALGQLGGSTVTCRNFLFCDLERDGTIISGTPTNRSEHGTLHRVANFRATASTNGLFTLTNCLLISVTNQLIYEGANVVHSLDDTGFFQTVGAGAHYLASGSTNRNAGTTNINPELLVNLGKLTTYPPVVLSNAITSDTTLSPQAQRDTDAPDLGFHYQPLDYLVGGITVTNATLTVAASTAVGIDASFTNYGIRLDSGASIVSEGRPENLNRIARNHLVQELPTGNAAVPTPMFADTVPKPAVDTAIRCRFTEFPQAAGSYFLNQQYANGTLTTLALRDSQVWGGLMHLYPNASNIVVGLTNCLLDRVDLRVHEYTQGKVNAYNNLFREGAAAYLQVALGSTWEWRDNLFDRYGINFYASGTFTHSHNGFVTGYDRLTPTNANDQVLSSSPAYETGPLGWYYLPTNSILIDTGSRYATNATLYHFTTTTNQVKETNSIVDIGLHYVAVNSSGEPIDTDGDGLPDYFEDANGNGSADSGETDWQSYNSLNGLTGTPGLQVFTPLK